VQHPVDEDRIKRAEHSLAEVGNGESEEEHDQYSLAEDNAHAIGPLA
jgi:hypothetical protein